MPELPAEMLRRLYRQGSLRNTEGGFELVLWNTLAPGTLIGVGPVSVDGQVFPPERITILTGRSKRSADRVSERGPLSFPVNGQIRLHIAGNPLAPGWHTVVINAHLKEVGSLSIEIEDRLAEDTTGEDG